MQLFSTSRFTQDNPSLEPKKQKLVYRALRCLEQQMQYLSVTLNSSSSVKDYVRLQLGNATNEIFAVLFLNNQHRLITFEKLFFGSIHTTVIHPRVIVQRALHLNAAAVVLAHNHPSGNLKPSDSDIKITRELKKILNIIDVEILDHIIVSKNGASAFSECGLMM